MALPRSFWSTLRLLVVMPFCLIVLACGGTPSSTSPNPSSGGSGGSSTCGTDPLPDLVINELSSNNDGNAVDEFGNADDWIEIVNRGPVPVDLRGLTLRVNGEAAALPSQVLEPGTRILLWADQQPEQGPLHLPIKLAASGFRLTLSRCAATMVRIDVPRLDTNETFARFPDISGELAMCRYASPQRDNGATCGPPLPPPLIDGQKFTQYTWTLPHPAVPPSLIIDELALRPAGFIELLNAGTSPIDLSAYRLQIAPMRPGKSWPVPSEYPLLPLADTDELLPGARSIVPVTATDVASVAATPNFEGVVTLFAANGTLIDRVDFARWPESAVLARTGQYPGRHVYCSPASPGAANDACNVLQQRDVGDYVRHLRTPGDFEALAYGSGELGMASVKVILDMSAGNQIYLVGSRDWSLHYEFIREVIDGQPTLNRCNSQENLLFNKGWYDFSVTEYFQTTGRRYLLGTLVHHAASDLYTLEFAVGDTILPEDMRKAFFAATAHVLNPELFHMRPQDADQSARALTLDGSVPIVGTNAPFTETKLQPLTASVGYGILTYVPAAELESASLGPDVIVVTDDVPNDIPLIGGLITEAFQTPLSHVNVLCQNRGTPNLALPKAHLLPELAALIGQLVRFQVTADGYHVDPASPDEAQAFWDSKKPNQTSVTPALDATRDDFVDLRLAGLKDLPSIGAKAAQLAELVKVANNFQSDCRNAKAFKVPSPAFALPMSYFIAHAQQSGARSMLEELLVDPAVLANRTERHQRLAAIRKTILTSAVDKALLARLNQFISAQFGNERIRMRSSSNAEDVPGFNGAGLYSSVSAAVDDPDYPVDDALREVWASLYSNRGFDERLQASIDQRQVAMAVLIHPAFPEERANAVVISRNMDDLTRGDIYSFNVQLGEAAVTNPAPGVTSDQFTYQWPPRTPAITTKSVSSFNGGLPILSAQETVSAACAMRAIVNHFRSLLDPESKNAYFTMDMEMKLLGASRDLLIKQARPFSFGAWEDPGDCREF